MTVEVALLLVDRRDPKLNDAPIANPSSPSLSVVSLEGAE
eukprot:CAMPEP_0204639212 /NCGR_PEP_ID=MMETSP0717-20131115/42162_1 /ASSEMBLY_ACC=CAM_ASM_000666 /TAXON_ID=230516 /ORGANISM="Chaetoceros curvisetus" /LENGTH=39 /DNA_ID=CAMNT_0051659233 /DNA_START=152 /DNA_END=268 /DNA_ORIENTATION=+